MVLNIQNNTEIFKYFQIMNVYLQKNKPYLDFIKINPGQWVVIKPNLVKESKETDSDEWRSVITDPSLIGLVSEYVCIELKGKGKLTICDAPQTDSSFNKILSVTKLDQLAVELSSKYNIPVEVIDLRNEEWKNNGGVITERKKQKGDPNGSIPYNLSSNSLFFKHYGEGNYYGADYDYDIVNLHHQGDIQEYLICATPVLADVFICMPKLKTHKKTGVTLSLKNLVGINADKNWLPHHTFGSPDKRGDEFPDISLKRRIETFGSKLAKKIAIAIPGLGPIISRFLRNRGKQIFGEGNTTIRSGNWHGNDTTWRMTLDLNRCLLYGNPDGTLRKVNAKTYYTVIDGIIGMEGQGPMQGDPKFCGIYLSGTDPVAVDAVAATMMGFDWEKIPVIREGFNLKELPVAFCKPEEIQIVSDEPSWCGSLSDLQKVKHFDFIPHFGWKNYIELPNYGS
jgi:uncharacterized protein (DUF362 family)